MTIYLYNLISEVYNYIYVKIYRESLTYICVYTLYEMYVLYEIYIIGRNLEGTGYNVSILQCKNSWI